MYQTPENEQFHITVNSQADVNAAKAIFTSDLKAIQTPEINQSIRICFWHKGYSNKQVGILTITS